MTLSPELARVINAPNVCHAKGRIFFAIYYDPPDDDAFKRAALHWKAVTPVLPDGAQIGGAVPRDGPFMVAGSPM